MDIYVRERVAGKGGGGGGREAVNALCVCVELEDWAREKLSGRVQLEDHSPKWRALRNFSFQPWVSLGNERQCKSSVLLKATK